jgi:hypothetical protein
VALALGDERLDRLGRAREQRLLGSGTTRPRARSGDLLSRKQRLPRTPVAASLLAPQPVRHPQAQGRTEPGQVLVVTEHLVDVLGRSICRALERPVHPPDPLRCLLGLDVLLDPEGDEQLALGNRPLHLLQTERARIQRVRAEQPDERIAEANQLSETLVEVLLGGIQLPVARRLDPTLLQSFSKLDQKRTILASVAQEHSRPGGCRALPEPGPRIAWSFDQAIVPSGWNA